MNEPESIIPTGDCSANGEPLYTPKPRYVPLAAVVAMQERHKAELAKANALRCPHARVSEEGITFCDHLNRNLGLTK